MSEKRKWWELDSAILHILAMILMLLDHSWATLPNTPEWMTCVGRIAFPIFAFLIVEGYFHTHNFKKYLLRMLIFAAISEVPFNLMYSGSVIYPFHQNVIWTFLLALLGLRLMDFCKEKCKLWVSILIDIAVVLVGFVLGYVTFVDYYGVGIVTVFAFYFFHGRKWWCFLGQLIVLYLLNVNLLGGYYYEINIGGFSFDLVQQGLALIALLPIWLYRGRQGYHSKPFQYFCYAFYPLHMLILVAFVLLPL